MGLSYLHGKDPAVVHSGFHTDDILINDSGRGILGGFGVTSVRHKLSTGMSHVLNTPGNLFRRSATISLRPTPGFPVHHIAFWYVTLPAEHQA
jgi:hypothetical protein